MAQQINPPRGMRDFLPVEKATRDELLGKVLASYRSFGFQEIETPALENIERLTSSDGGDNESLAFRVLKRGEELEGALGQSADQLSDLGLRYDLTVPLTRFYATNQSKLPKVLKAIQSGKETTRRSPMLHQSSTVSKTSIKSSTLCTQITPLSLTPPKLQSKEKSTLKVSEL
jgi:histidyl-tRNA synthetase